jgi:hypothetical protein
MEEIYGPYQNEADAHAAVMRMIGPGARPVPSVLSQAQKWQLLSDACEASALELGGHDKRVLAWLADYPDSTVAVLAALILRASGQGHVPVSVPPPAIERAAKLRRWMTVDPDLDGPGDGGGEWTVQDVITAAVTQGLDTLEDEYLPEGRPA